MGCIAQEWAGGEWVQPLLQGGVEPVPPWHVRQSRLRRWWWRSDGRRGLRWGVVAHGGRWRMPGWGDGGAGRRAPRAGSGGKDRVGGGVWCGGCKRATEDGLSGSPPSSADWPLCPVRLMSIARIHRPCHQKPTQLVLVQVVLCGRRLCILEPSVLKEYCNGHLATKKFTTHGFDIHVEQVLCTTTTTLPAVPSVPGQ